ncbi:MAG: M64 family metallopeptidase, partial [Acidobacteriota bacterium]
TDIGITSEKAASALVFNHHTPSPPQSCLDIAFLGEGYTSREVGVFKEDLELFADLMLNHEPYRSMKDAICIRGVVAPSSDAGCDEPTRGNWKRTTLGASFNALGSERYLLTENNRDLRDIAANVPYDALIIMINHERYGGGGIYNLFCTFTARNRWSSYLVLHEFGHSFAGLADEYYTSSVAYEDLHPPDSEPVSPNVTALLDPVKLKWRDLVDDTTPLPTPWRKKEYDRVDLAYQAERQKRNQAIAKASRAGNASEAAQLEADAERLAADHGKRMRAFLAASPMVGKVGAFEGAGYAANGLYRPTLDCLMFSRGIQPFCPVCRRAVAEMVQRYAGKLER